MQHARRARGFTQGTLSAAIRPRPIPRRHLSDMENGKIRVYWSTVGRVARGLAGQGATEADIERLVAELVEFPTEEAAVD